MHCTAGHFRLILTLLLLTSMVFCNTIPPHHSDHSTTRHGDGCTRIFIDLGSNLGVQVRKFFEPELFNRNISKVLRIFDEFFGSERKNQRDNCVFAFEPNPKHTSRLLEMESAYQSMGYRFVFFPIAVSTENASVTLLRPANNQIDAGATLIKNDIDLKDKKLQHVTRKSGTTVRTVTVDFVQFLKHHVLERQLLPGTTPDESRVLIKMDIEGEEYNLLPALISSGLLCQAVDQLLIEWHLRNARWFLHGALPLPINRDKVLALQSAMGLLLKLSSPPCKTRLRKLDDESYRVEALALNPLPRHESLAF